MPKVTQAYMEARRQQILNAASTCFSDKGFHQTTMQDVCRAAGLSPGAVYRYFGSKEEIIRAMVGQSSEQRAHIIEEAKAKGSTIDVLTNLADAFFSLLDNTESRDFIRLTIGLWAEALHNPAIMDLLKHNVYSLRETIKAIVVQAQARGDVEPALDAEAVAQVFTSLFDGLMFQKAMDPEVDVWKYVAVAKAMGMGLARDPRSVESHESEVEYYNSTTV